MSFFTRLVALVLASFVSFAPAPAYADDASDKAMAAVRPDAIRATMRFLADDLLEGRLPATRGYDVAALYVATQFEALGLQPAGDNGSYFQSVPLRSSLRDESKFSFSLNRGGKIETFVSRTDFIGSNDPGRAESAVEAPVVFVGFGVTAPDQNYDDYKGVDATGKIVAFLYGAPDFPSALKAHYSSTEEKEKNAVKHGAVGIIALNEPGLEQRYAFAKFARDLDLPDLRWLDKQAQPNDYFPELKGAVFLSLPAVKRFFEGSGHTDSEIFAAMKANKLTPFALPFTARITSGTQSQDVASPNIVAKLEGSDPALKNEYIVYSSHLDHVGVGQPVNGDKIYNGALDNASGVAAMLEIARAFTTMNPRPRRSILFVAVTGEEAGLLGSDYFAHYPTVPKKSMVANINVDEIFMLWPMRDVISFGSEHSSLEEVIKQATTRMHLTASPDPVPEETVFIRSDQYSFVKQGVPSMMISPGFRSDDPNIKPFEIFSKWEEGRYHQPQDDMNQPGLDFNAAAEFARFALLCGYMISENPQRPTWNKGDFFGDHYAH